MQDQELIQAYVKTGDEAAFAELAGRHLNLAYSAALRIAAGNHALAEEAVQKAFLLLARKAPRFSGSVNISGWIYQTACNCARDITRSERRREFYEKKGALMHLNSDADAEPLWQQLAPVLDEAISELPEKDRVPLILRFFRRQSMDEVAEGLGISTGAAKMRVGRALQKLRRLLAAHGVTLSAAVLGTFLWERSVTAAPPMALAAAREFLKQPGTSVPPNTFVQSTGLQNLTRIAFMTAAQKAAVILSVAALGFATWHVRHRTANALTTSPSSSSAAAKEKPVAKEGTQASSQAADPFADAIANLKAALTEPSGRKIPYARVDQAIAAFGANAGAALPVLMAVLNAPPSARDLQAFVLAAHGVALLGTNAAPAWPELRSLLRAGRLAILNDDLPKLLVAISPDGAILPDLIDLLNANPGGAGRIAWSIDQIVQNRPSLADRYTPDLIAMLSDPAEDVRRNAASVLARFPGEKSPEAVPVLLSALKLDKFLDPHAYDLVALPDNSFRSREGEKFTDDDSRLQSIQALGDFGPGAVEAIPALTQIANSDRTNNVDLGKLALLAIGKIDPDTTNSAAQLATRQQARAVVLAQKAQDGSATLPELKEALHLPDDLAIIAAADRLQTLGPVAHEALPDLLQALDVKQSMASFNIAQILKEWAPEELAARLKQKNAPNLNEIVSAVGEMGASMSCPRIRAHRSRSFYPSVGFQLWRLVIAPSHASPDESRFHLMTVASSGFFSSSFVTKTR
jgi:RNA polymerase sigma factor (sigma-70 family)